MLLTWPWPQAEAVMDSEDLLPAIWMAEHSKRETKCVFATSSATGCDGKRGKTGAGGVRTKMVDVSRSATINSIV